MCLFIRESRPSLLLERQVSALRISTSHAFFRTPDFSTFIQVFLVRPLRLLFTEPIIIMISIMGSVLCATFWLFAEALLIVYGSFGFSERHASLAFIPVGIRLFFGISSRLYDQRTLSNRRRVACLASGIGSPCRSLHVYPLNSTWFRLTEILPLTSISHLYNQPQILSIDDDLIFYISELFPLLANQQKTSSMLTPAAEKTRCSRCTVVDPRVLLNS